MQTTYNSVTKITKTHPSCQILNGFLDLTCCLLQHHSPLSSLPGVWTLLRPQGALPLWLSLPTPLRQQNLHVLLSPQQHRLQILLQRDWVPDGHADQPYHHLRWICTQVSDNVLLFYQYKLSGITGPVVFCLVCFHLGFCKTLKMSLLR